MLFPLMKVWVIRTCNSLIIIDSNVILLFSDSFYSTQRQLKYKVASSFDSKEFAEKERPEGLSDTDMRERELVIEEETTNLDTADSFAGREVGDIGKFYCCWSETAIIISNSIVIALVNRILLFKRDSDLGQ